MDLIYILFIMIFISIILKNTSSKSPPKESFINSANSRYENEISDKYNKELYNRLEKKDYYLKEDCIFNSSCILKPNNHSFFDYGRPVRTSPTFYSSQVINKIPIKKLRRRSHINKTSSAYKNIFLSRDKTNNYKKQNHSIDKFDTTNRKLIHIDNSKKHLKSLQSSLEL